MSQYSFRWLQRSNAWRDRGSAVIAGIAADHIGAVRRTLGAMEGYFVSPA